MSDRSLKQQFDAAMVELQKENQALQDSRAAAVLELRSAALRLASAYHCEHENPRDCMSVSIGFALDEVSRALSALGVTT